MYWPGGLPWGRPAAPRLCGRTAAMKIAIIGAGNVGSTLGKAWARKGREVFYGVRHPQHTKTQEVVRAAGATARAGWTAEGAGFGEVIVLATPGPTTEAAVRSLGNLGGKVVIECSNPLKADLSGLEIGHTTSGAELVAGWAK